MLTNSQIQDLRKSYTKGLLDEKQVDSHPLTFFKKWLSDAVTSQCEEPTAMVCSTVTAEGNPRARVVLFKGEYEGGLTFYTNYDSAKGQEMAAHSKCALTFFWQPLERQVRIEGFIKKVPSNLSDEYFQKRPLGSQIGAIASQQSRVVSSRLVLEEMFKKIENDFKKIGSLKRPENWGGYVVIPFYWEFWQGRENRLHDRIAFMQKAKSRSNESDWHVVRLSP